MKEQLVIALGIILVWRGVWVLGDLFDEWLFGSYHISTAILSIVAGILMLYFSDEDLTTLERL